MRKDTLYVSDMDGTLLGADSRISPFSSEIISDLSRDGALITVATARTPATVRPLLDGTFTVPPAVVMTGCAMWDRQAARLVEPHFLPELDVDTIVGLCRQHGFSPFVYVLSDDGLTLDVYHEGAELNRAERSFYEERARLKRFHLGTPAPARARQFGMLFFAMGKSDGIRVAADAISASTDCTVSCCHDVFNPEVVTLEIFPPGVDKARAVSGLKKKLGVERLVVFGASLNDVPMFAVADVAVAVGNALPEVKAAADVVIGPNYTDSVARFIAEDA